MAAAIGPAMRLAATRHPPDFDPHPQALVRMCAGCTLAALLPAAVAEARAPSAQGLLRCMGTSAFAFFLFAYQVGPAAARAPRIALGGLG
jgi:hypothetical protein